MKKIFLYIIKIVWSMCMIPVVLVLLHMSVMDTLHYSSVPTLLGGNSFKEKEWKAYDGFRAYKYKDLRENYLKEGMPISEVKELLGETWHRYKYDISTYKNICLNYHLGDIEAGGTRSTYYLIICPDKTGKYVESIKLVGGFYGMFDKGQKALIEDNGDLIVNDTKTSYDWTIQRVVEDIGLLLGVILLYKLSRKIFSLRV